MSEPNSSIDSSTLHLFSFYRSSCSTRLRIALHYKNLPFTVTAINVIQDEHHSPSYTAINPSRSVPTLQITNTSTKTAELITQSIAALEYLEEAFPSSPRLLPSLSSPADRASVRTLVSIIAADTQPVTNLRIMKRTRALAGSASIGDAGATWSKDLIAEGLKAYEAVCLKTAGKYSFGDEVTMADCCLVPTIWGAERWGVNLEGNEFATIMGVYKRLSELECVKKAHWRNQPDTPEEFRE